MIGPIITYAVVSIIATYMIIMINKKNSFSFKVSYILLFFIPYFILNKMIQDGFSNGGLIYFGIMFAFPSFFVCGLGGSIFEDSFGTFITKIKNWFIEYKGYILLFFVFSFLSFIFTP